MNNSNHEIAPEQIMSLEEARYRLAECQCSDFAKGLGEEGFVCAGCQIARVVIKQHQCGS